MIHPAKKPMEGGFSLDKFLPNLSPEDAEALGKMLDDTEAIKASNFTELIWRCPECGGELTRQESNKPVLPTQCGAIWFCHTEDCGYCEEE